jgi:hypothetical protein
MRAVGGASSEAARAAFSALCDKNVTYGRKYPPGAAAAEMAGFDGCKRLMS